jgi:hypothetical protein
MPFAPGALHHLLLFGLRNIAGVYAAQAFLLVMHHQHHRHGFFFGQQKNLFKD